MNKVFFTTVKQGIFLLFLCLALPSLGQQPPVFEFNGEEIAGQVVSGTEATVYLCNNEINPNTSINLSLYLSFRSDDIVYKQRSGDGLEGSFFLPFEIPLGTHIIDITYQQIETITITFEIEETKEVEAGENLLVCSNEGVISLFTKDVIPLDEKARGEWFFVNDDLDEKDLAILDSYIDEKGNIDITNFANKIGTGFFELEYTINNCSYDTRDLVIFAAPIVDAGDNIVVCQGEFAFIDLNNFFLDGGNPTIDNSDLIQYSGWKWTSTNDKLTFDGSFTHISQLEPGTYTLELSYSYDYDQISCPDSDTRDLIINKSPEKPKVVSENIEVCGVPASVLIELSEIEGQDITYFWRESIDPATFSPGLQAKVQQDSDISNEIVLLEPGTYVYEVYGKSNQECEGLATEVTITVNANPDDPSISPSAGSICLGQSFTFSAPQQDDFIYNWYADEERETTVLENSNTLFLEPDQAGSYTYYLERENRKTGCKSTGVVSATLQVNPIPLTPIVNDLEVCGTEDVLVTIAENYNPAQGLRYYWYNNNQDQGDEITENPFEVPVAAGTNSFSIYATQQYGEEDFCDSEIDEFTIFAYPETPNPSIDLDPNVSAICVGESVTFTAVIEGRGNYQYEWYDEEGNLLQSSDVENPRQYVVDNAQEGELKVSVKAFVNYQDIVCESDFVSASIIINSLPLTPTIALDTKTGSICLNETVIFSVEFSERYTYSWYADRQKESPLKSIEGNPNQVAYTASSLDDYTVYLEVVDNTTGCTSALGEKTVIVVALPETPTIDDIEVCGTDDVDVTIGNYDDGLTYYWSRDGEEGVTEVEGNPFSVRIGEGENNFSIYARQFSGEDFCDSEVDRFSIFAYPDIPDFSISLNPDVLAICEGESATFTAIIEGDGNYQYEWYDEAGNLLQSSEVENPSQYVVTNAQQGELEVSVKAFVDYETIVCESDLVSASVIVNPKPDTPEVNDIEVCGTDDVDVTIGNYDDGLTYYWSRDGEEGVTEVEGNPFSVRIGEGENNFSIYARQFSGEDFCDSEVDRFSIFAYPDIPDFSISLNPDVLAICEGESVTFTAIIEGDGNYQYEWYDEASNLLQDSEVENPSQYFVDNAQQGELEVSVLAYIDYETIVCESDLVSASVIVNPKPDTPEVNDIEVCGTDDVDVTIGNYDDGLTYYWSRDREEGVTEVEGNTFSVRIGEGENNFSIYARQFSGEDFCDSEVDRFSIFAYPDIPDFSISLNPDVDAICEGESIVFTASLEGEYEIEWYDSEGNLLSGDSDNQNQYTYSNAEEGTFNIQARAVLLEEGEVVCASGLISASVIVNSPPPTPTISLDTETGSICLGESVIFSFEFSEQYTYNWYADMQKEFPLKAVEGNPNQVAYSANTLEDYTVYLEVLDNTTGCVSALAEGTVIINELPSIPTLVNAERCGSGAITLSVNDPNTDLTYTWYSYVNQEQGAQAHEGDTYPIENLEETTTFYVTASTATCEGEGALVTATITEQTNSPSVESFPACGKMDSDLAIVEPIAGVTYRWYSSENISEETFLGTGTSFEEEITDDKTYYVTAQADGECESEPTSINFNYLPLPFVPSFQYATRCGAGTVSFEFGELEGAVSFNIYNSEDAAEPITNTEGVFQTENLEIGTVNYYVASVSKEGCESEKQLISAYVLEVPASPVLAAKSSTCESGGTVSASVQGVEGVAFRWFTAAEGGEAIDTDNVLELSIQQNTTYYAEAYIVHSVQEENIECINPDRLAVPLDVTGLPASPNVSQSAASICEEGTVDFSVDGQEGIAINWYADAALENQIGETNSNVYSQLFSSSTTNKLYVTATNTATGCVSAATEVGVVVNDIPNLPNIEDVVLCSATSLTLSPQSDLAEPLFKYYLDASLEEVAFEGGNWTRDFEQTTTIWITQVGEGNCESEAKEITVTVEGELVMPVIADQAFCGTTSTTLIVNNPVAGYTYNWYLNEADSREEAFEIGAAINLNNIASTTTYWVEANSTNGCVGDRVPVTVNIVPIPEDPVVIDRALCGPGSAVLSVNNVAEGVSYQWFADASLSELIFTGDTYTTEELSSETSFYIKAINANNELEISCESGVDIATVSILDAGEISIGDPLKICLNAPIYNLLLDVPFAGGNFTGTGVENGAGFNPLTAGIGTYEIDYTYTNEEECTFFGTRTIEVTPPLDAESAILNTATFELCSSDGAIGLGQFVTLNGGTWSGDGVNGNQFDPSQTGAGTFEITYEVENEFCDYLSSLSIKVNSEDLEPIELAANKLAYCQNEEFILSVMNPDETLSYEWLNGAGEVIGEGTRLIGTTGQNTTFTSRATALSGCGTLTQSFTLNIFAFPAEITTDKNQIDQHDFIQFSLTDTENTTYLWNFGTGESSTQQNPAYYYHEAGTFEAVVYMQQTELGCEDSLKVTIQVGETDNGVITDLEEIDIPKKIDLKTYPQPFQSELNVEISSVENADAKLTIYNADGRLVEETENTLSIGDNTIQLKTEDLPSGMYIIKVSFGETFKVLKAIKR